MGSLSKILSQSLTVRVVFYLIFIYIFLFCLLQFNLFNYFDYHDFDLAIYNQVVWNTLHGNFFYSSIRGGIYFKDHLPLILLLVLPIYAIFSSPLTLLFLQTIFIGLAAWPLFLLGREVLENKFCILIVFLYLIYPAAGNLNLYVFHPESFVPFLILFTFYYLVKGNFKLFTVFMILSLMCKEDVSLTVLMLGIYAGIIKKSKRWVFAPLLAGVIWFILSIFAIIPYFNKGEYIYTVFYSHLGKGPFEVMKTVALHPLRIARSIVSGSKIQYLMHLFAPVSFLPFFSPLALINTIPTFMRNLLSSYFATTSIIYQYTATLIPFIFISSVYGLKKILTFPIPKKYPNAIITSVLIIGLIFSWILGPQLQVINNIYAFTHNPDYLDYIRRYFIPLVPRGASVVATFDFLTKLSCREKLYTFHYIYFGREKVEKKKFLLPKDTEYALIDFQDFATFYVFYTPEGAENIRRFLEEGNWGIVKIIDSIALLKRNYVSNYKLYESVGQPHMQNKKEMDMDNQLTFLGYDTKKDSIDRKCILNLSLYWKCKEKISKDFTMIITISDPEKKFVLQKPQELCYNIYRTSEWKSGEVIKGNYWIYLPLINHLTEYLVNITILDKKGKAVSNINFNS